MRSTLRVRHSLWLLAPLGAAALLVWSTLARLDRIDHIESLAQWSVGPTVMATDSATGYAEGRRSLVASGRAPESYPWIQQTQAMLLGEDPRVRRVDYDNAPFGRENHAPSLYRLWLGLSAWMDHLTSNRPLGLSVERAARWADPALSLLFLLGASVWLARVQGRLAASLFAFGWVSLHPLAAGYLPGSPDPSGLAWILVTTSLLAVGAGIGEPNELRARRRFFIGGVAGGLGLSISLAHQLPVIVGLAIGALAAAAATRQDGPPPSETDHTRRWRIWALGGALTSLLVTALETLPGSIGLRLEINHPLYAFAWLGLGEAVVRSLRWIQTSTPPWRQRGGSAASLLALAAMAALPVVLAFDEGRGFFALDPLSARLTPLSDVVAGNVVEWFRRDGPSHVFVATTLTWIPALAAAALLIRGTFRGPERRAGLVALGPVVLLFVLASMQLRATAPLGAALLGLAVALAAKHPEVGALPRFHGSRMLALVLVMATLPGLLVQLPAVTKEARTALGRGDVESIVERDLAFWLARQSGGNSAVVLASPTVSSALAFHGGLRGVGTLAWENQDGLRAAVRIARATSPDEALALLRQREVRYIVLTSWDTFLEDSALQDGEVSANSFIGALRRWVPLRWVRPIPYRLPKIPGFEDESVVVLEVVEEQEEARTLSLQAEYFIETGRLDLAAGTKKELQRFPSDLGARIALAKIEGARGDAAGFSSVFTPLLNYLEGGADRSLPWDRRVSLAALLEQGKRADLAEVQVRRCLGEGTDTRLRSLTTGALYRLLQQGRRLRIDLPTPQLQQRALELLPPDLAARSGAGSTP